nr:hypothetical protein [Boudabousia marimammalium]
MNRIASIPVTQRGPDGRPYTVRRISAAVKDYTCPACGQIVPTGSAHVVAWPNDSLFGPEADLAQRRHWHTHCWDRGLRPLY